MVARIKFDSEIFIEGENMTEIVRKWQEVKLFNDQTAEENGLAFCEVVCVENDSNCEDITNEFAEYGG